MLFVIRVDWTLSRAMVNKTMDAPINLYFDKTPTGSILNRFSKDLERLDQEVMYDICFSVECLTWVIAVFIIGCRTSLWVLAFAPIFSLLGFLLLRYFIPTYRNINKLASVANSPIVSHFGETLSGTSTIRAYDRAGLFIQQYFDKLNRHMKLEFWREGVD